MDEDFYLRLIYKELDGSASEQEANELATWLEASAENRAFAAEVRAAWTESGKLAAAPEANLDAAFGALEAQLLGDPEGDFPGQAESIPLSSPPSKSRSWLAVAAGIAALFILGWIALPYLQGDQQADWKTVYSDGEIFPLTLPDGSIATLNKNSSLSYLPAGGERTVKLEGEAFFEVKPGKNPFTVQTATADVTVLGTSFNVRSYPKDPEIRVQVSTGKVRFALNDKDLDLILLPGERGIFNSESKILQREAKAEGEDAAWRYPQPAFEDTPLNVALFEMEQFYGIEVRLETENASKCPLTADFEGLEATAALESIATILGGELSEEGQGKYVLKNVGCD